MKIAPEKSVFINCPFDEAFTPLFDAIVFAMPKFKARRRELGIEWVGDVPWNHVLVAAEENMPGFDLAGFGNRRSLVPV